MMIKLGYLIATEKQANHLMESTLREEWKLCFFWKFCIASLDVTSKQNTDQMDISINKKRMDASCC